MTQTGAGTRVSRIPEFANREEEAAFWDTHDVTDHLDEFEPVDIQFESPLSEAVTLHIDLETMEEVRAHAAARDMPLDVLLQIWILERRDAERQRRAAAAEPSNRATNAASEAASGTARG